MTRCWALVYTTIFYGLGSLEISGSIPARGEIVKGVVLDIDGVLYRGGRIFKRTAEAMKLLQASKIPYVFVTNGGGQTESKKSTELARIIGVNVRPEQVILAHTPFQKIAEEHKNQRVLIVGHEGCMEVAKSYGFTKVACVRDIHEENPSIYPHRKPINLPSSPEKGQPIEAILLFHDCLDWGLEMQIIFDVIVGRQQNTDQVLAIDESLQQKIPFFTCNSDIVYASNHNYPRFTQGAFVEAFRSLFELTCGGEKLIVQSCGKPQKIQYEYATESLNKESLLLGQGEVTRFYGVGDNPKSDIRGANNAGEQWTSVLVRTGVFSGTDNCSTDPADYVVGDILDAVNFIVGN